MTAKARLEIFDKYFTNIKEEVAAKYAEIFHTWILNLHVELSAIHTQQKGNSFEHCLKEYFGDCLANPIEDLHDRWWVFRNGEEVCVLSVGGSFNGLGKKICLVNKVPDEDIVEIMEALQKN